MTGRIRSLSTWGRRMGQASVMPILLGTALAGSAAEPVFLTTEHADVRMRYLADASPPLEILVTNGDRTPPVDHASTNVVLVVAESSKLELPTDLPPLGSAGDPIWVLPGSPNEALLYLGISAAGNVEGIFDGPLEMRLLALDGPGHFFLWQAELGGLTVVMNSRDGLGPDDTVRQPVGGHGHFDWGFTTSGVYRLTLQASGHRGGDATNVVSDPTVITFHVLPLPAVSRSPFELWQSAQWPHLQDPTVVGPESDPDGDGLANLWEYALGRSPHSPDPASARGLSLALDGEGAAARAILRQSRAVEAIDVDFRVDVSEAPFGPWMPAAFPSEILAGSGGLETVIFRDPGLVKLRSALFYRVEALLKDQP